MKKIFAILFIFILSSCIFLGCSTSYYQSEEYQSLTPREKAIEITEREGEYYKSANYYAFEKTELIDSTFFATGLSYHTIQDELSIYYYQEISDSSYIQAQIWLTDDITECSYGIMAYDENTKPIFVVTDNLNPKTFTPQTTLKFNYNSYAGDPAFKTQTEQLTSTILKIMIFKVNESLEKYNLTLSSFGFINF